MQHRLRRSGGALFAAALVLAACSDDSTTATTEASRTTSAPAGEAMHSHDHGIEIGDTSPIPTLAIEATPDAKAGVNLRVRTTDFTFAPEHASTAPVAGEGHAHVYVDGEKVGRVYTEWMHLALEPGTHEVHVDLNANNHSPLLVHGEPIEATATVEVPEPADAHSHSGGFEAALPYPSVSMTITEDPMSGWNVHVEASDFTFSPEKASTMHTESGEGHAHLYVDGRKVARLYGPWFHFGGDLPAGPHEFRVELNTNDHVPYLAAGEPVEDVATVTVAPSDAATDAEAKAIEVSVLDGKVDGGGRHTVALGTEVVLSVTSDVADEVHVHGYDVSGAVAPGEPAEIRFTADIPGVFEVELEQSAVSLLQLEVS